MKICPTAEGEVQKRKYYNDKNNNLYSLPKEINAKHLLVSKLLLFRMSFVLSGMLTRWE